jgi:type II secretory pathway component GspD/PulD (secretin)
MRLTSSASIAITLLSLTGAAFAQSSPEKSTAETARVEHRENGVPFFKLIATVAKKTGKKFIVDPRVHGEAEIVGQDTSNISFSDLLTILHIYGYAAIESGGYVSVVPDANARQVPIPLITGKETRPDAEFVTKVITVRNIPAVQLVPLLRPMIPQMGHLVALPCVNKLIYVDTFANLQRLQAVIEALDVGEPYKPAKCDDGSAPPR